MSVYYDPMISKLVVHAENRPAALRMMVFALSRYQIGGIKNNIEFVSAICKHPAFVKGSVTTHFIDVCGHVKRCTISSLRLNFASGCMSYLNHMLLRAFFPCPPLCSWH